MKNLRAELDRLVNDLGTWVADIDPLTVTLSAIGAVVVWVALKAVGGIVEEYARRLWFRDHPTNKQTTI
jgi:hypothetical protein